MLLDILERQDHELLPDFCDILDKSGQRHVARLIRENVCQQQQQQQSSKHIHAHTRTHTCLPSSAYILLVQIFSSNKKSTFIDYNNLAIESNQDIVFIWARFSLVVCFMLCVCLLHANDTALSFSSLRGLQNLIDICSQFGSESDIKFNLLRAKSSLLVGHTHTLMP